MGDFTFGRIKTTSKKQDLSLDRTHNILLADKSSAKADYDFTPVILVEESYSPEVTKHIEDYLKSQGLFRYKIISAINCELDEKTLKKEGKIRFYRNNKADFEQYLDYGCPIITSGDALYSLLLEDDIYPSYMEQIIFGVTNFWYSKDLTTENCHRIFPIESLDFLLVKGTSKALDCYKTKLAEIQISTVIRAGDRPLPRYSKLNKLFIYTKEDFLNLFYEPNKNKHNEVLAWDTETSGLNFLKDRIGCITLSFDGITGYYIHWKCMDEECKSKLNEILKNNRQCMANGKFDVKLLWKEGVNGAHIDEDVIILGHVLDETRSNSLKTLAFLYSEYGGYERPLDLYKERLGKGKSINYIDDIPEEMLRDYAVMDAIVTRRVWENMMKHLHELDKKYPNEFYPINTLERYYYDRNIPATNMYSKIEYRGCYVDKEKLDALRQEMKKYLLDLKRQLSEIFDVSKDFDWGSGKEVGKLLEKKGWEDFGRTKSGEYATADFQLKRWEKTHKKESKLIQEMRSIGVLLNTFVGDDSQDSIFNDYLEELRENSEESFDDLGEPLDEEKGTKGWSQYLTYHPEDNSYRMHPDYFSMGTDSGRTRCRAPNMQNVVARGNFSNEIKSCLVTPDDNNYYMVTADYASLQARLAAIDTWDSEDNIVKALRKPDADLHASTGFLCFARNKEYDIEEITVEQDGQVYHFLGGEEVVTQRGSIFAKDLTEEDTLII